MTLWAVHIGGSDEYIAVPDEQRARQTKLTCDRLDSERGQTDPLLAATVVEWPFPAEAHARQLRGAEADG